jgi:uncharacterized protein YciI
MKKTIAVFMRPGSHWDPRRGVREQDHWDGHAAFMDALFDQGVVLLGGPFADGTGSLVIFEAESPEAVRAIYRDDPWTKHDILVVADAKEWTIFLDARKPAS